MEFYEGCSDGTFEIARDFLIECILCGEKYRIDRHSLNISIMDHYADTMQGRMSEHYFFGECNCRGCGERLFYRVKVYECPAGEFHHMEYLCDDVDFLEKPKIKVLGMPSRERRIHLSNQISESLRRETSEIQIALTNGNGQIIVPWQKGTISTIQVPIGGGGLADILIDDLGCISFRDNRFVLNEILTSNVTKTINNLLGKIAEAVIVRRCRDDAEINCKWFEKAKKQDINLDESKEYNAVGTGLKSTVTRYPGIYNPNDTQRDIVWVDERGNLAFSSGGSKKAGRMAGLQIKVSGSGDRYVLPDILNLRYEVPIVYFAVNDDFERMVEKFEMRKTGISDAQMGVDFIDVREIDPEAYEEVMSYRSIIQRIVDHSLSIEKLISEAYNQPSLQNALMTSALSNESNQILIYH